MATGGKACRRSHDAPRGLGPLHLLSAWASEEGIALGQVATDQKSNEITAIPPLLKRTELKGTLVTIDAVGLPKEIARDIAEGCGDFVIAVKDNQPKLRGRSRGTSASTWSRTSRTRVAAAARRARRATGGPTSERTA